jgi:hypothetical protein
MPTADLTARRTALMARTPTTTLVDALRALEATDARTPEERLVRSWTIDELERRHPAASAAVEAAYEAAEATEAKTGQAVEVDYVAVLLAVIGRDGIRAGRTVKVAHAGREITGEVTSTAHQGTTLIGIGFYSAELGHSNRINDAVSVKPEDIISW